MSGEHGGLCGGDEVQLEGQPSYITRRQALSSFSAKWAIAKKEMARAAFTGLKSDEIIDESTYHGSEGF